MLDLLTAIRPSLCIVERASCSSDAKGEEFQAFGEALKEYYEPKTLVIAKYFNLYKRQESPLLTITPNYKD